MQVNPVYAIGKYEGTAGQHTPFLNAVAATDTYGLYNTSMTDTRGCQIVRSGSSGSYTYSVAADRANRPVNYVSFWDAARFVNWLHNGQGNGDTESGVYVNVGNQSAFTRSADAEYRIPTENEWYKAAYHKDDGVTGNCARRSARSWTSSGRLSG
ncbi:MAG: formylglycine-generating enzyme family protein [Planctomycetes bacterium]|nr:formylglycine-generating enzyme family protein [Planctomycetota bacterium]